MRYSLTADGFKSIDNNLDFVSSPQYDEIVDYSSYRQDSDNIRNFISSGTGSSGELKYDDPNNMPSNFQVSLRSGKFDKGEVSQMILKQQSLVEKSKDLDKKKAEQDNLEKINKARQDYIDKKTGFSGQVQE